MGQGAAGGPKPPSSETAKVSTAVDKESEPRDAISEARRNGDATTQEGAGVTFIPVDDVGKESIDTCPGRKLVERKSFPFADMVEELAEVDRIRQQTLNRASEVIRKFHRDFSSAIVSKMNVYHHARRGNRHIIVIDNAIPFQLVEDLYQSLLRDGFRRTEFARPDTRQYKHHLVEYDPTELRKYAVTQIVSALVKLCFPAEPLEMYRVYTNAVLFGDVAFMHRDSDSDDHITALLYPNLEPEWRAEFGGETVFYDEDREIIDAVEPRPGRLCVFTGSILHKGSPPGRLVYESRFTTAFKFSPIERKQQFGNRVMLGRPNGGDDSDPEDPEPQ